MSMDFIIELQSTFNITATEIKGREIHGVCQRWLQCFSPNVKRNTGEWIYHGYWWHAYSFGHEQAIIGLAAFEKYQTQPIEPFFVYHESNDTMFDCIAISWPDLRVIEDDIHVFPHTMTWAFLTTHEMSAGLGPYFALPPP